MEYQEKIAKFADIIKSAENICVFTGAGISVPSGIPDFRSADGLYNQDSGFNIRPEEIISHTFFVRNTDMFYEFYKSKMVYSDAKPNAAHLFFAELEKQGKEVSVVTQNIDGLHSAAGSTEVYEIHGSVLRNICTRCGKRFGVDAVMEQEGVPHCDCGGVLKPDVVLYEEPLDSACVEGAVGAISRADTMVIIGTSLVVYPAASYVRYFRGRNLVIINLEPTGMDDMASLAIYEDVEKVVNDIKSLI